MARMTRKEEKLKEEMDSRASKVLQLSKELEKMQLLKNLSNTQLLKIKQLEINLNKMQQSQTQNQRSLRYSTRASKCTPTAQVIPIQTKKRKNQKTDDISLINDQSPQKKVCKEEVKEESTKNVQKQNKEQVKVKIQHKNKECDFCHTSLTPLWRHGPKGYSCLCNTCGVKWKRGRILREIKPITNINTDATLVSLFAYPSPKLEYDGADFVFSAIEPKKDANNKLHNEFENHKTTKNSIFSDHNPNQCESRQGPQSLSETEQIPKNTSTNIDPISLTNEDRKLYLEEMILNADSYKLAQLFVLVPQVLALAEKAVRGKKSMIMDVTSIDDDTWGLISSVLGQ